MTAYHLNELTTSDGKAPRLAATGYLGHESTIADVVRLLDGVGVAEDRLYFLQGDAGITALEHGGTKLSRLFEGGVREGPLEALRSGTTVVAIAGVEEEDVERIQDAMATAGVVRRRYFGLWSNNAYR